jgi:HlyD family secretion protein
MKRLTRALLWLAVGSGTVIALVAVLRPAPVEVDAAIVSRGPLLVTIEEEGRTRVRERYVVSTPAAGLLDRVRVRPGDRVRRGAVIATLRPGLATPLDMRSTMQLQARLGAARDELARARSTLAAARAEFEFAAGEERRAQALNAAGALSDAARELASTRLRTAEKQAEAAAAAVRVAEHAVHEAEAALLGPREAQRESAIALRSPVDATVLRLLEESERVVPAGAAVLELGDPALLEVIVDVLSTDAMRITIGARALLQHWGRDDAIPGIVRKIEPSTFTKISALGVEEQRVNVIVDFDCLDLPRFGDGFSLAVQVVVDSRQDVVLVPLGALFRAGDGWATYVIDDTGRARLRPVTVGARAAFDVECLGGLQPGERVVLYPGDRVADGSRVRTQ